MVVSNITTVDNPYNPFDDYKKWFNYDVSHGYNTSQKLGRFYEGSRDLPPTLENQANTEAIDRLVAINPSFYKKIERTFDDYYK